MGDQEDQPTTIFIEEEEVDPQEQDAVGPAGSVRSYECIFCKRGFTTAQALGGHMNIHRKDRAKSTSSSRPPNYLSNTNYNNSNNIQEDSFYANPRFYHPIFASYPQGNYISTSPYHHQDQGNNIHYNISSTSSSTTARPVYYHENINYDQDVDVDGVMTASPSREEEKMMKSSRLLHEEFGWSHGVEDKDSRSRIHLGGGDIQEDELDLELRLGQI